MKSLKRHNVWKRRMCMSLTVIWSDAVTQGPCLFSRIELRAFRLPPMPLRASVLFWCSTAIKPCLWPWLLKVASSNQPQSETRGWEAHCLFSQFYAALWWETYESMLCACGTLCQALCAWLSRLHRWPCMSEDPHRWRTENMAAIFKCFFLFF